MATWGTAAVAGRAGMRYDGYPDKAQPGQGLGGSTHMMVEQAANGRAELETTEGVFLGGLILDSFID